MVNTITLEAIIKASLKGYSCILVLQFIVYSLVLQGLTGDSWKKNGQNQRSRAQDILSVSITFLSGKKNNVFWVPRLYPKHFFFFWMYHRQPKIEITWNDIAVALLELLTQKSGRVSTDVSPFRERYWHSVKGAKTGQKIREDFNVTQLI